MTRCEQDFLMTNAHKRTITIHRVRELIIDAYLIHSDYAEEIPVATIESLLLEGWLTAKTERLIVGKNGQLNVTCQSYNILNPNFDIQNFVDHPLKIH